MKVVGNHMTALSRHVGEAVRIMRRGMVLNSKSEFSRCKISRLSLEQLDRDEEQGGFGKGLGEELTKDWTTHLLEKRDGVDRDNRQNLGRVQSSISIKRIGEDQVAPRRVKKRRYELLGEEWGTIGNECGLSTSGLEGVKVLPIKHPNDMSRKMYVNENKSLLEIEWDGLKMKNIAECSEAGNEYVGNVVTCTKLENVGTKKRVWTRLRNGLYAWRYLKVAKKSTRFLKNDSKVEQSHFSGLAEYLETRFEDIYSNNGGGKNRAGQERESSASGVD